MPVAVTFALQVASRVMIGEGDLRTVVEVVPERLPSDYIHGQLVFLATGQPVVHFDDDLEFLVVQFLQAIPPLAAGESAEVVFSDAPGGSQLAVHDQVVRMTGDLPGPFDVPAAEFLPALLDCCRRFVAFARATFADDPAVRERIGQLDPWVDAAAAALGTSCEGR
jgi:hypothetical protein